ncbi:MAG: hypothetical protein PHU95_03570 [Candidatus Thermoplasmatota archaeon]|nr:hypothetical protein [Candidatus Thermoplasmatota archaeon]MDD5778507.1 hypothetical protein [Candidatus Thermoplasmatota archaeon]
MEMIMAEEGYYEEDVLVVTPHERRMERMLFERAWCFVHHRPAVAVFFGWPDLYLCTECLNEEISGVA